MWLCKASYFIGNVSMRWEICHSSMLLQFLNKFRSIFIFRRWMFLGENQWSHFMHWSFCLEITILCRVLNWDLGDPGLNLMKLQHAATYTHLSKKLILTMASFFSLRQYLTERHIVHTGGCLNQLGWGGQPVLPPCWWRRKAGHCDLMLTLPARRVTGSCPLQLILPT